MGGQEQKGRNPLRFSHFKEKGILYSLSVHDLITTCKINKVAQHLMSKIEYRIIITCIWTNSGMQQSHYN